MSVTERIRTRADALSPAERRVATAVVEDPQLIAFGTVAEVAERAGTSAATVVRLATRLGYEGFVELQSEVQGELTTRLGTATERIRRPAAGDLLGRVAEVEIANIASTFDQLDRAEVDAAVALLAARNHRVFVAGGHAGHGVVAQFRAELSALRGGVTGLPQAPAAWAAALVDLEAGDCLVVVDLPRFDRALLDLVDQAAGMGARLIAVTDGPLSPLARRAEITLRVVTEGSGPFDSYVSVLAVLNLLTTGVAGRLRTTATRRLDRVEEVWRATGALSSTHADGSVDP